MQEKLLEEVVAFIDGHLASPTPTAQEAQADSASEPTAVGGLAHDSAKAKM